MGKVHLFRSRKESESEVHARGEQKELPPVWRRRKTGVVSGLHIASRRVTQSRSCGAVPIRLDPRSTPRSLVRPTPVASELCRFGDG